MTPLVGEERGRGGGGEIECFNVSLYRFAYCDCFSFKAVSATVAAITISRQKLMCTVFGEGPHPF